MKTKEYTNGEITVIWNSEICIHSAECIKSLPRVFNPRERPWIKMENSDSGNIISAVTKCPSGAISIK